MRLTPYVFTLSILDAIPKTCKLIYRIRFSSMMNNLLSSSLLVQHRLSHVIYRKQKPHAFIKKKKIKKNIFSLTVDIEHERPTKVFVRNTVHFLCYHILLEINRLFFTKKSKKSECNDQ